MKASATDTAGFAKLRIDVIHSVFYPGRTSCHRRRSGLSCAEAFCFRFS
jgi:hypothetical protein